MKMAGLLVAGLLALVTADMLSPITACAGQEAASWDISGLRAVLTGKHKREVITLIGPPDRMVNSYMTPSGSPVGQGAETRNLHESGLWIYGKPGFLREEGSGSGELRIWFDMNDKVLIVTRD